MAGTLCYCCLFLLLGMLARGRSDTKAALGDACPPANCSSIPYSACKNGICTCWDNFLPDFNYTRCYPDSILYEHPCEISPQCRGILGDGAVCQGGMCLCQNDFMYTDGRCKFKIDLLGHSCHSDDQVCYLEGDGDFQNTLCLILCACAPQYNSSDDNLRCVANEGSFCKVNTLCTENAECVKGFCRCKEASVADTFSKCLKATEYIGGSCEILQQCTYFIGEKVTCKDHVCSCEDGFAEKDNKCLRKIDLVGEKCDVEKEVCYLNADDSSKNVECIDNKCTCNAGYTVNKDKTKCIADLGSTCLDQITCTSNGVCLESVCECGTELINDNKCIPVTELLGGPCTIQAQCSLPFSNNSFCNNNVCSCRPDSAPKDNKCFKKVDLVGTRCLPDEHVCYLEADDTSENVDCIDYRCVCKQGYNMSADKKKCSLRTKCLKEISCIEHAECVDSFCQCSVRYIEINDECNKVAELIGDYCIAESQCLVLLDNNTVCENNMCLCRKGTAPKNNKCLEKKDFVDTECDADKDVCYLEADETSWNVECIDNKCTCEEGYTASAEKDKCIAGLKSTCIDKITCMNSTRCYDGNCICTHGTMEINNICVAELGLGAACNATSPPCIENAECVDNTCQCKGKIEMVDGKCKEGAAARLVASLMCVLVAVARTVVL